MHTFSIAMPISSTIMLIISIVAYRRFYFYMIRQTTGGLAGSACSNHLAAYRCLADQVRHVLPDREAHFCAGLERALVLTEALPENERPARHADEAVRAPAEAEERCEAHGPHAELGNRDEASFVSMLPCIRERVMYLVK